ncbi:MAG: ATP-binding protein [Phycisphaerae bacterium]|nr:ATP-binding protein [Phycisphaerae bacterium]
MKIVIASGKGGTGKTTIATNLARVIAQMGKQVQYLDCDVEEPNGHIFLKPDIEKTEQVTVPVPDVDLGKCTGCGRCGEICQYSAIVSLKKTVLTFEQLCHSCGGCMRICPVGAISEKPKVIGLLEQGSTDGIDFVQGRLEIGDVRTPALIKYVKKKIDNNKIAIIDAPPGTSCPVVEAVRDADFVLLVTEPTPFGLNDLKLAVDMVRQLKIPFSVIINRSDLGDDRVHEYCKNENIDIAMELADDIKIARAYSSGRMVVEALPEYKQNFTALAKNIGADK